MTRASDDEVLMAYTKCLKRLNSDETITAASTSAGFLIPSGQKRGHRNGLQVFVKVCRYSDALLKKNKLTGGLLCEDKQ